VESSEEKMSESTKKIGQETTPSLSFSLIIHKSEILSIQRQLFSHSLLVSDTQIDQESKEREREKY
jgi:hypothetical protein